MEQEVLNPMERGGVHRSFLESLSKGWGPRTRPKPPLHEAAETLEKDQTPTEASGGREGWSRSPLTTIFTVAGSSCCP